jgi:hypothetical protein
VLYDDEDEADVPIDQLTQYPFQEQDFHHYNSVDEDRKRQHGLLPPPPPPPRPLLPPRLPPFPPPPSPAAAAAEELLNSEIAGTAKPFILSILLYSLIISAFIKFCFLFYPETAMLSQELETAIRERLQDPCQSAARIGTEKLLSMLESNKLKEEDEVCFVVPDQSGRSTLVRGNTYFIFLAFTHA